MPKRSSKAPTDINQLAKMIAERVTAPPPEQQAPAPPRTDAELRSQAAAMLGRLGGLKGGKARDKALSKKRKSEIAKQAAKARWATKKP